MSLAHSLQCSIFGVETEHLGVPSRAEPSRDEVGRAIEAVVSKGSKDRSSASREP